MNFFAAIAAWLGQRPRPKSYQTKPTESPSDGDGPIIDALMALRKTHGVPRLTAGIAPKRSFALISATHAAGTTAEKATDEAIAEMIELLPAKQS